MADAFTGGCQCGAVRFRVDGPIRHASICNCRMCQKALGNFIAPFVSFKGKVEWTRGQPTEFRSSQNVRRGFCSNCGTPLSYRWGDHQPSLTIGSFDDADAIVPTIEFAHDNRHPIFAHYDSMHPSRRARPTKRDLLAILRSFQHPDHDTEQWSPGGAGA